MCMVYGLQNVITKSTVNQCVFRDSRQGERVQAMDLEMVDHRKEGPGMVIATGINKLIDRYEKCLTRYGDYVKK